MRKSLFGNLIIGSFLVIGIILVTITVYFTTYMESFAIREKARLLESNVDDIEDATYFALTNQSEVMDIMFQNIIDTVSSNTQSSVTVFDNNGFMLATSGKKLNRTSFEKVSDVVSKPVLKGESIVTMDVYRDKSGEKILTVGAPLIHDNEIYGGVMFNQLVPDVMSMYDFVSHRMIVMIIIAMVMAGILFYVLSLRITSPISKMNAAVIEFSKGNFANKVHYTADNEFGELAKNINMMAASLDNLENLRKGFISDVSHELRTPLTTISGFVEGILDGTIPEEARDEYLEVVLSESKRLSRLITSLLQVSRMESGEAKLDRSDFDLNELARVSLLKFEMMITSKNIDVSLNIGEGRLMVNADKDNITQVFINLINNAVKFTPEGGSISIEIEEKRDKAVINIINTGHGIESDKLQFIWDRFYKTDKSRSEDRTGMGLGLYIVKRILDMHNENIQVQSRVDEFTKFTFTLAKSKNSGI